MPTNAKPSLRHMALGDLERELDTTRQVLERLPDEKLGWKPHSKSFSLGELGAHVANLLMWARSAVEEDGFDLAGPMPEREAPESAAQILETFDTLRAEALQALDETDDAGLTAPWTLRKGDQELFSMPKFAVIRTWALSHIIHHRGQLTVYLRLLEEPVPPTYGPTADEAPPY